MKIDEKELKMLVEEHLVSNPRLCVMDSGMNVSLSIDIKPDFGVGTLHAKRGGVRVMSPQTGLRFAKEILGADEITVVLKNGRE